MASTSSDDTCRETAEMPFLQARQRRQLKVIRHPEGTLDDLMDEQYAMAQEDLDLCLSSQLGDDDAGVKSSAEKVIDDHNVTREMVELLRSIPRPVIEAIIDNTIGHKYSTDASFRELFMKLDDSAGVYLNTFVTKAEGKGLTRQEWQSLQDMMQTYVEGSGVVIGAASTPEEKRAARTAAHIDKVYARSNKKLEIFIEQAENGETPNPEDWRQPVLPSPLEENSDGLGPQRGHPSTSNALAGWLCQEPVQQNGAVMKIDVEIISVPILKIWKPEHMVLGEILVTSLASSLIAWGGFNPRGAGTTPHDDDVDLRRGQREVFEEHTWLADNMASSKEAVEGRLEALRCMQHITITGEAFVEMQERKELLEETSKRFDSVVDAAEEAISKVQTATEELEAHNRRLVDNITRLQSYVDFRNNVQTWLKGQRKAKEVDKG